MSSLATLEATRVFAADTLKHLEDLARVYQELTKSGWVVASSPEIRAIPSQLGALSSGARTSLDEESCEDFGWDHIVGLEKLVQNLKRFSRVIHESNKGRLAKDDPQTVIALDVAIAGLLRAQQKYTFSDFSA